MAVAVDRCLPRAHGQEVFSILGLTALSQQPCCQDHPSSNTQEHRLGSMGKTDNLSNETQAHCSQQALQAEGRKSEALIYY